MSTVSITPKICVVLVIENLEEIRMPGNVFILTVWYILWACVKIAI